MAQSYEFHELENRYTDDARGYHLFSTCVALPFIGKPPRSRW